MKEFWQNDDLLVKMRGLAEEAAGRAYSPYSGFPVGAAVLTGDGSIFTGANVENAAYGLTNCAERSAIFAAVSAGHREIRAVVIYTPTLQPTTPCGSCRQVINEFGADAWIISFGREGSPLRNRLDDLLPHAFGPANLVVKRDGA